MSPSRCFYSYILYRERSSEEKVRVDEEFEIDNPTADIFIYDPITAVMNPAHVASAPQKLQ